MHLYPDNRDVFEQITVLAPGLLGASVGMAVAKHSPSRKIHVWARRAETRVQCELLEWCHAVHSAAEEAVKGADLVIICSPVETIAPLVERIAEHLKEGAIVTDVGSTKSLLCHNAKAAMPAHAFFVGSHPMAGSEKSGLEYADRDLFKQRPCFVTPLPETPETVTEQVVRFWMELGMQVCTISPETHDEIVAYISHLPHILASTLCAALQKKDSKWRHFAGAGLRDTTRIASGSPILWKSILEQNREEILRALDTFEDEIHHFRSALANREWFEVSNLLEHGKHYRDSLSPDATEQ